MIPRSLAWQSHDYIAAALVIAALYVIYRGLTSPKRGPWDARRVTAAIISVLIVALAQ